MNMRPGSRLLLQAALRSYGTPPSESFVSSYTHQYYICCVDTCWLLTRNVIWTLLDLYTSNPSTPTHTHTQSYSCELKKLPPELSNCFVQLQADEDTQAFLNECTRKSNSICLQFFYSFVQIIFGLFLSQTSINGYV